MNAYMSIGAANFRRYFITSDEGEETPKVSFLAIGREANQKYLRNL